MGDTLITVKVCNPKRPTQCRTFRNVLVDTGATDSFFPRDALEKKGVRFAQTERARVGTGGVVEYAAGDAVLVVKGRTGHVLIGEAARGTPPRLGVVALEVLGFKPNPATGELETALKRA